MRRKPTTRDGYNDQDRGDESHLARVRAACLHVVRALGPLTDHVTVIGGLAPCLLIPEESLPAGVSHVATLDLDLGLSLGIDSAGVHGKIAESLLAAQFQPDAAAPDPAAALRWKYRVPNSAEVWVDLIVDSPVGGVAPWLPEISVAFEDRSRIEIGGHTLDGEPVNAAVWVCGPGAFLLLKAIAYTRRREPKDAHDLYFVLRYFPGALLASIAALLKNPLGQDLLKVLETDFSDHDDLGPLDVAQFLTGRADDDIQADVVGEAQRVLEFFRRR